ILKSGGDETLALPKHFSPDVFHQIRFLKIKNKIVLQLEMETLGIVNAPPMDAGKIALSVRNAAVAFDMARFTVL
ncbi:MAG TPA: hypothetical protein VF721_00630, partial [Pyrinomonadaceae bacterium]